MNKLVLPFVKYSGNGNDFIILDHPKFSINSELVRRLCDRHFGVGADGILELYSFPGTDGGMRIYNADGGEAEMCGNGLRCLATYVDDIASVKKETYTIKTMHHTYSIGRDGNAFAIEMSEIKDQNKYDLSVFDGFDKRFFINTGVPHLVLLQNNIKAIDIKKIAPEYRHHKLFPNGTNVNFVEVVDSTKQRAYVRTYERGVEDETHSCGTGLTATALALSDWFGWKEVVTLQTLGGEQRVRIGQKIFYAGDVVRCFKGEFEI
jgi:diaminopimelate epimerase